ncbi:hypothetical protein [Verrucomicrobium spinosum]|uniref:hypothetical protein n=1 Tax=Verrucomicrobium spinosum TaxID=2736 RepID=UPI0001745EB9|nr:hypothetical protein [Verrucomicrobium spinosum]
MSTPSIATYIDAKMASTIIKAVQEAGLTAAHETFATAVTWPFVPLEQAQYPITVTPEVTAAMIEVATAGQLFAFAMSGVSAQEIQTQAVEWQADLSGPGTDTGWR